nr:unnamed protein product [Callosobruchus chinensis]
MARRKARGCRRSKKSHRHVSKHGSKEGRHKKRKRCHKGGRKTTNPFLNYLRMFRKHHCDWPCWCKMTAEQKKKYYRQACRQQHKEMKCRGGAKGKKKSSRSCSRAGLKKFRGRSKYGRLKRKGRRSSKRRKQRKGRLHSKKRSACGRRSKGRRRGRSRRNRRRPITRRSARRRSRRFGSRRSDSCKGRGIFSSILERGNSMSVVIDPNKGITFKS